MLGVSAPRACVIVPEYRSTRLPHQNRKNYIARRTKLGKIENPKAESPGLSRSPNKGPTFPDFRISRTFRPARLPGPGNSLLIFREIRIKLPVQAEYYRAGIRRARPSLTF